MGFKQSLFITQYNCRPVITRSQMIKRFPDVFSAEEEAEDTRAGQREEQETKQVHLDQKEAEEQTYSPLTVEPEKPPHYNSLAANRLMSVMLHT
ncbi:hypothetical protein PROFUN_15707 [Planoprotostelium fungivorum]|uniref:Uncharacterized protein n=1 Tax=Planoprotostelium fungivorum TaxID=1890364 RepID=A0A2P6MSC0_9EUKA|nr:hypothetical protein PROFUN_15707 [Planoprotostelium fungivorum]